MDLKRLLDGALEWAEQGVPVFPCGADKRPLTKHGVKDATTDPRAIRTMFERYERGVVLIGAAMGRAAGLFAVDVDLYKGPEAELWLKDQREQGNLPPTREHTTLRGGVHLIYSSDSAWPNCKPADGVDVKGDGGYIIVPPSEGYSVARTGLAAAPRGLVVALEQAKAARSLAPETALEEAILRGADFHDSLAQLAARKAADDWSLLDMKAYLEALLERSDARHPVNPRHSRWASFMRSPELMNIISSARGKFSVVEPSNALVSALNIEKLREVAFSGGFRARETVSDPETKFFDVDFPYSTSDGYFAHTEIDLQSEKPIIEGICYENEVTLVSADPKAGKTVFAIDCGLSVAHGRNLGTAALRVPEAGPVLYFGLEGRSAIRKRVTAWRKHHNISKETPAPFFAVERAANFYDPARRDPELERVIQANRYWVNNGQGPIKLVVIDTLTKAMIGGNQNDADDTAKLFEFVSILRDRGVTACLMIVHHKRKAQKGDPGDGPRGSSNILAECDISLHIKKEERLVSIHVAEARSIEDGATYYRNMVTVPLFADEYGNEVSSVCMEEAEAPSIAPEASTRLRGALEGRILSGVISLGSGDHSAQEIVEAVLRKTVLTGKLYKAVKWYSKDAQDVLKAVFDSATEFDGHQVVPAFDEDDKVTGVTVSPLDGE